MPKTIGEIARETGFSATTVWLVANGQSGKYRISKATRRTIEEYIEQHGIVINHAARALKLRRTDAIGLIVPDIGNAFFARLMAGLEELCRSNGLVLLTVSTGEDPEREDRAVHTLWARGVDGLIVAPCRAPNYGRLVGRNAKMSIVVVDRAYPGARYPAVTTDHAEAMTALTRAVLATGARSTAFLCGQPELPSIADRIRGFAVACREAGIAAPEELILRGPENSVAAGRAMMDALLAGGRPPASFVSSSLMVLEGAMQSLKERTGHIPPDTVIGTFDDQDSLDFLPNRVFSARQDERALAAAAFARLLSGEAPAGEQTTVPCELIGRGGARAAPVVGSAAAGASPAPATGR